MEQFCTEKAFFQNKDRLIGQAAVVACRRGRTAVERDTRRAGRRRGTCLKDPPQSLT